MWKTSSTQVVLGGENSAPARPETSLFTENKRVRSSPAYGTTLAFLRLERHLRIQRSLGTHGSRHRGFIAPFNPFNSATAGRDRDLSRECRIRGQIARQITRSANVPTVRSS